MSAPLAPICFFLQLKCNCFRIVAQTDTLETAIHQGIYFLFNLGEAL